MLYFKAPYIIADIGSSWRRFDDGKKNKKCALQHIEEAAKCGVTAVKFQLFSDRELYGFAGKNKYALPKEWIKDLALCAKRNKVDFMCTAFSPQGLKFIDKFVTTHKIASSEMLHLDLVKAAIDTGKPVLISTGGHSQREVEYIREVVSRTAKKPNQFGFLQCVAAYPANENAYNLNVLRQFDFVGISDHSLNPCEMALIASGAGAMVFERHFKFTDNEKEFYQSCPDDRHSSTSFFLEGLVQCVDFAKKIMGAGEKKVHLSEVNMMREHNRRFIAMTKLKNKEAIELGVNVGMFRSKEVAPNLELEMFGILKSKCWTNKIIPRGATITKADLVYNK